MSIKKAYIGKLKKGMREYGERRREIIKQSDDALHHAKRAIFAMHRGNTAEAREKMLTAEGLLNDVSKRFGRNAQAVEEGAYKAALEEYAEAALFEQFVSGYAIGEIGSLTIPPAQYIAGLCDVPGELYRYAIQAATRGDAATAQRCASTAGDIVGELIEFNLTSYLRTKFDQAQAAAHKLERVVYELSLK